jgi:glycosyltransferase involved in cell wall biosynthesis
VAIVHDYLNQTGGAERVVLEMARMWPESEIYTSLYRPDSTFEEFRARSVRTSPLDALPVDRSFRTLFPLYPVAFRAMGEVDADVVVSSSSGWAHLVRTSPRAFHAVYCHTPARWLWTEEYGGLPFGERAIKPLKSVLRRWDASRAQRPDLYIAANHVAQARIRAAYGRHAPVVHPPVDTDRFVPGPRGERLLVVSRLLPYKRIDLAVDAATRVGVGLDVVGDGPCLGDLRDRAGPTVEFHGHVDDQALVDFYQHCRALCVPGREDFGIVAAEAMAAGKPVIAFASGGALETVVDGVTGVLFTDQNVSSMIDAIRACDGLEAEEEMLAARARRFSSESFRRGLVETIWESLQVRGERIENGRAATANGPAALNGNGRNGWAQSPDVTLRGRESQV